MRGKGCSRRGRLYRRAGWRFALLMPPVLFWSSVFASLAGARPPGWVPGAAQILFALAWTLAAALAGRGAVRRFRH